MPIFRFQFSVFNLVLALGAVTSLSVATAPGAEYEPGKPFTYLFETGAASPEPLSAEAVAAKRGWTLLAEDDTTHQFRGDAVVVNDRLALVVRQRGKGAEVYGQKVAGISQRAVVTPLPPTGDTAAGVTALKIVENTPAAVSLEVTYRTADNRRLVASYGLSTGRQIIELKAGEGMGRLLVGAKTRYAVVPDLFADDMVFGPAASAGPRLGLPAENMLLNLLEGGDAMLMCLWRSSRNAATAVLSGDGTSRTIDGCEIECEKPAELWVALIEGPRIWREEPLSAEDARKEVSLDWKPPFPGRWRTDMVRPDGAARSWDCIADKSPQAWSDARSLVIYPLDRTRTTPLTAFCPADMLRATLGVGPCQYILQTEGLATETNPTPDQVMTFVEQQFEKRKEKQAAGQIGDLLDQMVDQVRRTEARIDQYAAFARGVYKLIPTERDGAGSDAAFRLRGLCDEMEATIVGGRAQPGVATRAEPLARQVKALIGKANSLAECRRLGGELRSIGAEQDRILSKSRMMARWLRQQASALGTQPRHADLAAKIIAQTDEILK